MTLKIESKEALSYSYAPRRNPCSLWGTISKVAKIAALIFSLTSIGVASHSISSNQISLPRCTPPSYLLQVSVPLPTPSLESPNPDLCYASRFTKPGIVVLDTDKTLGCSIKSNSQSRGICYAGLNPLDVDDDCAASKHLRTWITTIDELSEQEICTKILETYSHYNDKPEVRGKYRQKTLRILHHMTSFTERDEFKKLIQARSPTEAAAKHNLHIFNTEIFVKIDGEDELIPPKSEEAVRVLDLLRDAIPPFPFQIPSLMLKYAAMLKEIFYQMRYCTDFNPILAATRAHSVFVFIHPFNDYNGHFARLILRTIFELSGYQAPIFPDYDEYRAAVISDFANPGHFANYLAKTLEWTEREIGANGPCSYLEKMRQEVMGGNRLGLPAP